MKWLCPDITQVLAQPDLSLGLGSGLSAIDTFKHREYLDEINLSFTLCVANRPSGSVYRLAINAS
jgi:hypothetical protein